VRGSVYYLNEANFSAKAKTFVVARQHSAATDELLNDDSRIGTFASSQ
jgi:hypothetical protein